MFVKKDGLTILCAARASTVSSVAAITSTLRTVRAARKSSRRTDREMARTARDADRLAGLLKRLGEKRSDAVAEFKLPSDSECP